MFICQHYPIKHKLVQFYYLSHFLLSQNKFGKICSIFTLLMELSSRYKILTTQVYYYFLISFKLKMNGSTIFRITTITYFWILLSFILWLHIKDKNTFLEVFIFCFYDLELKITTFHYNDQHCSVINMNSYL